MNRHIVLTLGRSGSNTLRDMLNQNPEVLNFGEVLGEWTAVRKLYTRLPLPSRNDEAFLDHVLCGKWFPILANNVRSVRRLASGELTEIKSMRGIRTWGVKDFSLNFARMGLEDYLLLRPEIKVLGLVRQSITDRMISNALLQATGVVELRGEAGAAAPKGLRLDPSKVRTLLDDIVRENDGLRQMLDSLPSERVLRIDYDELFAGPAECHLVMGKVFRFLDVHPYKVAPRMTKIRKAPLSEMLENYDDCLVALQGTSYADLFRAAG